MAANRSARPLRAYLAAAAIVIVSAVTALVPNAVQAREGQADVSYVVMLRSPAGSTDVDTAGVDVAARRLTRRHGGTTGHVFSHVLRGFEVRTDVAGARRLAADPEVAYIGPNRPLVLDSEQVNPPAWGLDRIDHRTSKLNYIYDYTNTGAGVRVYVIDSGVNLTHPDLAGRAFSGWDVVGNDGDASDCHGHGSHVAGIAGGREHGVAKGVTVIAVRAADCVGGGGSATIIAGMDWVRRNLVTPAVVNVSMSVLADPAVDAATRNLVAAGATVVVSAGNTSSSACDRSPARVAEAITVSATDMGDTRPSWANFGTCVDIFAPGVDILSLGAYGDATITRNGTSMAAPHVAGAAAQVLAASAHLSPAQVAHRLIEVDAARSAVGNPGSGSLNRRLRIPAFDAWISCESSSSTVSCQGAPIDGVGPYSIQWIPFSQNNVTYVSSWCWPGEYFSVTAHFTDATGTRRTEYGGVTCTDIT